MRPQILVVATITAVLTGAGGGVALAASHKKLTVELRTDRLTVVDTGTTGPTPGDMVIEDDTALIEGKPAGTASFTCIAHSGDLLTGNGECSGTVYLKKGQLETQGYARSTNGAISGAGAITGGTRRYEGVRGSYRFSTASTTGNRILKIRLRG
jgi:hypothetical protein